jgi:hypothetical protein
MALIYAFLDTCSVIKVGFFFSLVILAVFVAVVLLLKGKSPQLFLKEMNIETYLFGVITFMSLVVTISALQRAFNQLFDWDRALVKIEHLMKRGKQIKVFSWTPLLGGITHRARGTYTDFHNRFMNSIRTHSTDDKDIEIVCLDNISLEKHYNRYKEPIGPYDDKIVKEAWEELNDLFTGFIRYKDQSKLYRASSDVIPTFFFFLSEKELIVLLPFYMPLHDAYRSADHTEKVQLFGFSTHEKHMINSFERAFDFYKNLISTLNTAP